ncbi:MAG TPA: hypothetical protein VNW92_25250 [Polyangiaceae bacterium]|nr:hypothetical protein [Polyangiaceae bacterium]
MRPPLRLVEHQRGQPERFNTHAEIARHDRNIDAALIAEVHSGRNQQIVRIARVNSVYDRRVLCPELKGCSVPELRIPSMMLFELPK